MGVKTQEGGGKGCGEAGALVGVLLEEVGHEELGRGGKAEGELYLPVPVTVSSASSLLPVGDLLLERRLTHQYFIRKHS